MEYNAMFANAVAAPRYMQLLSFIVYRLSCIVYRVSFIAFFLGITSPISDICAVSV
jgi:hypothetical protein